MFFYEYTENIDKRVSNASIAHLKVMWERIRERRGGLPLVDDLSIERLAWCAEDLMLLEALPRNDYRYVYYGEGIARAAGFDMKGLLTSGFDSEVGNFFREKYKQCLRAREPLYTVHQASHAKNVHTWERLILPLEATDKRAFLLVFNKPLASRNEYLASILASALSGIVALAPIKVEDSIEDFQILLVNEAAARIIGRSVQELEGQRLNQVLSGLMGHGTFELCRDVARSGRTAQQEVDTQQADVHRSFVVRAARTTDAVTLAFEDVSELRQRENELRESEARLRAAQRIAALGSWEWNIETDAVWWSDQAFVIYGVKPRSFDPTLRDLARAVHPDDWPQVRGAVQVAIDEGSPFDVEHRTVIADGSTRRVRTRGEFVARAAGRPARVVGVCLDVTKQPPPQPD